MKIKPRELLEKEAKLLEHYNDVIHYPERSTLTRISWTTQFKTPLSKHYHPSIL